MAITVPPDYYDQGTRFPLPRTGQQTVGTAPLLVCGYNPSRLGIVITNTSAVTVFVGPDKLVSTATGHALLAGNTLSLVSPAELWGVVAAGTALVTTLEEQVR